MLIPFFGYRRHVPYLKSSFSFNFSFSPSIVLLSFTENIWDVHEFRKFTRTRIWKMKMKKNSAFIEFYFEKLHWTGLHHPNLPTSSQKIEKNGKGKEIFGTNTRKKKTERNIFRVFLIPNRGRVFFLFSFLTNKNENKRKIKNANKFSSNLVVRCQPWHKLMKNIIIYAIVDLNKKKKDRVSMRAMCTMYTQYAHNTDWNCSISFD